jgi:hypothetical protein
MEKEYWLFTLLTTKSGYINCWFEGFPSKRNLVNACRNYGSNDDMYAIINITKLTEEQYNKLTKDNNE